jgi:hypothetical protein
MSKFLADHFRQVYFGGNCTFSNMKDNLTGVSLQQAKTKIGDLNTILALTYHIHYYVRAVSQVLDGGPLDARDMYSFDHPDFQSQEEWEQFLQTIFEEAEQYAAKVEQVPDSKLEDVFVLEKYGNYLRNFQCIIEHTHYHLGQIAILKKMVAAK